MAVEEHERVQRLILRRGSEASLADEMIEELLDVCRAELGGRYPPPVRRRAKREKPANPMAIDAGGLP